MLPQNDATSISYHTRSKVNTSFLRAIPNSTERMQKQLLPKHFFLENLRRERHRIDRSNSAISLLVIHIQRVENMFGENIPSVLQLLQNNMRETDNLGYLDTNVFGLLLPDTAAKEAQVVMDRILETDTTLSISISAHTYPDELFEKLYAQATTTEQVSPLFYEDANKAKPFQSLLKRSLDIVGALTGLVLLSPLLLTVAIAIKLTSPGPVIFKQIRLGKSFSPFVFYKFRSMDAGADDRIHRKYVENLIKGNLGGLSQGEPEKPIYKLTSDHRVTRVGKIIRKTSIDEFPQLFNVLKGEMSLIGPRPPIPYETENYQAWHLRRILGIKPGITGLWQIQGRNETSFDDMVRLDLQYCQDWSILLDLEILIKTIRVVLQCRGVA